VLAELIEGVGQLAAVDRQAPAPDAVGEVVPQLLELAHPLVQGVLPALGYPLPVPSSGGAVVGEQARTAATSPSGMPTRTAMRMNATRRSVFPLVTALVARSAPAADQALPLVEVQC
jgi:hypothetical protein